MLLIQFMALIHFIVCYTLHINTNNSNNLLVIDFMLLTQLMHLFSLCYRVLIQLNIYSTLQINNNNNNNMLVIHFMLLIQFLPLIQFLSLIQFMLLIIGGFRYRDLRRLKGHGPRLTGQRTEARRAEDQVLKGR